MASESITAETLKARAALAGVTLDEQKLEDIAHTMNQSLETVRTLDFRAMLMVEPAVIFRAAWND